MKPTAEAGQDALRGHVLDRAMQARAVHGPIEAEGALARLLEDRRFVRKPVRLVLDRERLSPGQPAALAEADEGYDLVCHPGLAGRPADLAAAAVYQLVRVNYGAVATFTEAELFGAALTGTSPEQYYRRLCALSDELWA